VNTPTVKPKDPNWKWGNPLVGFAQRLNIIQPSDFDDEPTIPYGLCGDELVVEESDIIEEETID
jgi:hypothetical protein